MLAAHSITDDRSEPGPSKSQNKRDAVLYVAVAARVDIGDKGRIERNGLETLCALRGRAGLVTSADVTPQRRDLLVFVCVCVCV